MKTIRAFVLAACAAASGLAGAAPPSAAVPTAKPGGADAPSRAAAKGCKWRKISDARIGLEAWVQRCDYGDRTIDFAIAGDSLVVRYSDAEKPDPVVDVIRFAPGETAESAMRRVFDAHTPKTVASRCVAVPYVGVGTDRASPKGAKRWTFKPDAAYQKEIDSAPKDEEGDIGDPMCGEWGDAPDGIQYFETFPGNPVRALLFVRVGQDEPLFDERTLKLVEPAAPAN